MTATVPRRTARLGWIDTLRGFAIALMVLDHVLALIDPTSSLRYTLTRLSLPAFMICAAAVWKPASPRRIYVLALVAAVEVALYPVLGLSQPGIVTLYLAASIALSHVPWLLRNPAAVLVVGLVQALYLPLPWAGYEPGLVLAWFMLGRLAVHHFRSYVEHLPPVLGVVGRRPVLWYVGHLAALVPLAVMLRA